MIATPTVKVDKPGADVPQPTKLRETTKGFSTTKNAKPARNLRQNLIFNKYQMINFIFMI